jgi:hypothetical protein
MKASEVYKITKNTFERYELSDYNTVTCIFVATEQLDKHVPAKKNSSPTTGKGPFIARQRAVNKSHQQ